MNVVFVKLPVALRSVRNRISYDTVSAVNKISIRSRGLLNTSYTGRLIYSSAKPDEQKRSTGTSSFAGV